MAETEARTPRRVYVDAGLLGAALVILVDGLLGQATLDTSLKLTLYSLTVAMPLLAWGVIASVLDEVLVHERVAAWIGRIAFLVALWALLRHFTPAAGWIFLALAILVALLLVIPRISGGFIVGHPAPP